MRFDRDGAELFRAVLEAEELRALELALAPSDQGHGGTRIADIGPLQRWLSPDGRVGKLVRAQIGERAHPVRAILFDKNDTSNWSLGWHQDRTIAVRSRHDVQGFGPWTVKQGIHHVEPPFGLIERMVTVRIHLDPVDPSNAPLLISPGTHLLGRLNESRIPAAVEDHGVYACTAAAGDVWLYKTPIVHASARAEPGRRRRVLQVDYSADDLPNPLQWQVEAEREAPRG